MSESVALLRPEQVSSLVLVNDQCEYLEAWAEGCESVPELQDARNKLAAIDEYLSRTSAEGRVRVAAAQRRLEGRIGTLIGVAHVGTNQHQPSIAIEGSALTKDERHQFRQMAAHPEVVEQVIAESTDEHPASRRKVMEAVKSSVMDGLKQAAKNNPVEAGPKSRAGVAARVAQAREMAATGSTSRQIAAAIGISVESMSDFRSRNNIEVPADAVVGRPRAIDTNRVVRTVVQDASALSVAAGLIDYADIDLDEVEGWVSSLNDSIRFLTNLRNALKKEQTQRG